MVAWDALLFGFEGTCVERPRGMPYHDGRRGRPASGEGRGLRALAWARGLGRPLALVADGSAAAARGWFVEQGVSPPEVIVGHHDTVLHRPSPAPWLEALRRLGVPPGPGVLCLADRAADIVAAVRAGLTAGTLSDEVSLDGPPSLFFDAPDALSTPDLAYAAATRGDPGRAMVTLAASRPYGTCRVGGRTDEAGWEARLAEGRAGRWPREMVTLAHTLVIHALGARPRGAALTWWPDDDAAVEDLARSLRALTSLPVVRPLPSSAGEADAYPEQAVDPELAGRRMLVLTDRRRDGVALDSACARLALAGAPWVGALALAQVAAPRGELSAAWGPRRHVNDDLRLRRSQGLGEDPSVA